MNRRQFTLGGLISLTVSLLVGCPTSPDLQQQLEDLLTQVGAALKNLDPLLEAWNPKIAVDIDAGFTLLESAVNGYQPGNSVASIENAVNALVTALQAIVQYIPQAGPYLAMVQLIVATVEGILALLPNSALNPANTNVDVRRVGKHVQVKIMTPQGWVSVTDPATTGKAFTTAWDELAPVGLKIW